MTFNIKLIKINEVFYKVETSEKSILAELSDYFKFKIPNSQFHPLVKRRAWDGFIRLFDRTNNLIYCGLINHIREFCKLRCYKLDYEENKNLINENIILEFIEKLNLPFLLYDYQIQTLIHGINNKRALILSPTSSGKTSIIYTIIRYFVSVNDTKVLLIVPVLNLIEQGFKDFETYSKNDSSFEVKYNVHKIFSGQDKHTDKQIIISSWQSLYKLPKEYFDQFGMVICDESHLLKSDSLKNILEKCTKAEYRFGTTGTLDGSKCNSMVIEGLTGPIFKTITTKNLMDQKKLANLSIQCIILKHKEENCKRIKKLKYPEEIDFIISEEKRNRFIRNLAISQKGNSLVLFQYVKKHGIPLYKAIQKKLQDSGDLNRKVFYVSGITKMEDRELIRNITEQEENAIIVASGAVFSTGVNIKNLESIIFASPSKSRIRTLQSIGRVLRVSRSDKATLYDIVDDLSYKKHKNFSLKHFLERANIYDSEQFDYEIYQIDL